MLDKRSILVLKSLNKLSVDTAFKVVTSDEIIATLTQKSQFNSETIKEIVDFLEKHEYLNIKFSEENTYCYSLTPKARIFLENEKPNVKNKQTDFHIIAYAYTMIASFIGTVLAFLLLVYII